ncbi:MAG: thioredoxin family protein [Chloroflexi bacterium]|nr:thioredoxin family protein [Chloroflexota bacterium]
MLTIKILGSGCANCKRLEQIARKVVEEMSIEADVVKVTEYPDIMVYGITSTPGLVINEKVMSFGRIPTPAEVTTWVADAMQTA